MALLLNVALIAVALAGGGRRPVDRVFAVFASSMVLWNGGVFWLRAAGTADEAFFAEVVVHMGVIALPAVYLHFVLAFLDDRQRPAVAARELRGGRGIRRAQPERERVADARGHVDVLGMGAGARAAVRALPGLLQHGHDLRAVAPGPRAGGRRFELSPEPNPPRDAGHDREPRRRRRRLPSLRRGPRCPAVEHVYPIGIPANMVFAIVLGTAILRYRLFDVSAVMKAVAAYGMVWAVSLCTLVGVLTVVAGPGWATLNGWLAVASVALAFTLILGPLGRGLDRSHPAGDLLRHSEGLRPPPGAQP